MRTPQGKRNEACNFELGSRSRDIYTRENNVQSQGRNSLLCKVLNILLVLNLLLLWLVLRIIIILRIIENYLVFGSSNFLINSFFLSQKKKELPNKFKVFLWRALIDSLIANYAEFIFVCPV